MLRCASVIQKQAAYRLVSSGEGVFYTFWKSWEPILPLTLAPLLVLYEARSLYFRSVLTFSLMSPYLPFFFAVGGCVAKTSVTALSWQQSHMSSLYTSPTSPCVRGIASAAHTSEFKNIQTKQHNLTC